jgi:hypothetical protein
MKTLATLSPRELVQLAARSASGHFEEVVAELERRIAPPPDARPSRAAVELARSWVKDDEYAGVQKMAAEILRLAPPADANGGEK